MFSSAKFPAIVREDGEDPVVDPLDTPGGDEDQNSEKDDHPRGSDEVIEGESGFFSVIFVRHYWAPRYLYHSLS